MPKTGVGPLGLAILALMTLSVRAQTEFPTKTITIIVPFPAGTGGDAAVRAMANEVARTAGRPVVIENRPGASGIIAAQTVARAAPDGYTLLLGANSTHAANVSLFKTLPYSPLGDFEPITLAERAASVFVVPAASPVRSMDDLTAAARAKPGSLNAGVAAATTVVSAALYKRLAKIDFTAVTYQGAPQLTLDVVSSRLDFAVTDVINTMTLRQNGDLRALAVTSPFRVTSLPDVPTMAELGFADFAVTSWGAYFAPRGTPKEIVARLNKLIHAAYETPPVRELANKIGNRVELTTPEGLRDFVKAEIERWRILVENAGLPAR